MFFNCQITSLSNIYILGEQDGFLDEAALLEDHLVDLELSKVIYRSHSLVDFLLAQLAVNCIIV